MKFLHVGDLHLGKSLGNFDLIEDQRFILDKILSLADSESADCVLIAGDVYDKAIPSEAAVRLLDHFLRQLAERKISVVCVSGNHDSDDRLNFGSTLFASNHIFISAVFDGKLHKQSFQEGVWQNGAGADSGAGASTNPWTNEPAAPAAKKICGNCGYEAEPDFEYCPKCGNKL